MKPDKSMKPSVEKKGVSTPAAREGIPAGSGGTLVTGGSRLLAFCVLFVFLFSNTAFGAVYPTLRRGDVSDDVRTMKRALAAIGYSLTVNDTFDATTEALVRAFQRTHALNVDGIADSVTLETLYRVAAEKNGSPVATEEPAEQSSLRFGSSGQAVTELQQALIRLGYSLNADGKYGSATYSAVSAFQRSEGLTADGVAGQETLSRLYARASDSANRAVTAVPTAVPDTERILPALTARVTTSSGSLNLRKAASGTAQVLRTIPNGAVISVLDYGTVWSSVRYGTTTGYVMTRFITLNASAATAVPTPNPVIVTATPASRDSGASLPQGYAYVNTADGGTLNLRSAASETAHVVITVPNGALVRLLAFSAAWTQIYYRGYTGYVMTSYLTTSVSAQTQAPIVTAAPAPAQTSSTIYMIARVTTSGGGLNLRESASAGSRVVTVLPNGASVTVTAYNTSWCAVTYGAYRGYVMTRYLALSSIQTAAAPTLIPISTGTASPRNGMTARVVTSGGSLNLRQQPSPGSQVITTIPNSMVLNVSQYGGVWCRVTYGTYDGYVMTKYLTILSGATNTPVPTPTVSPAPAAPVNTEGLFAQVSGGTLNMRSGASSGSSVLTVIPSGAFVTVTSYGSLWSGVSYGGYNGYVMTQYLKLYSSGQPSSAAPTAAPNGTASAGYDTTVFTRTLRAGYTGTDVTLLQRRLAELGYLSSSGLNGVYDDQTMTAVKLFQKMHGLSQDGLAGTRTFAMLFASTAVAYNSDISQYSTLHIYYNAVDTSLTSSVQKLQSRLRELGYTCNVTGRFDETTYMAVLSFQLRNGITVSGAADPATQQRLYASNAKGPTAPASLELEEGAGYMSGPTVSQIQLLHWYNSVRSGLSGGSTLLIYDPTTHLSWNLRVMSCGRHADCEPASLRDTLIMFRALGQPSWTVHPVYVRLPNGEWTMATMHDRPHLSGSLSDNGFDGHLCVHFLRDMAEAQQNDPNYGVTNQNTLREAWKALTGETVP